MQSLFKPLVLYPDRKSFNKKLLDLLLERFTVYGGRVGTLKEADIVLSNHPFAKPTVNAEWISKSITEGKQQPLNKPEVEVVIIEDEPPATTLKRNYDSDTDITDLSDSDIEVVYPDKKRKFDQTKYVCMDSSKTKDEEKLPNREIIDQLQKLLDRYTVEGDRWRIKSYRTAISALKKYPTKIKDKKEALLIRGIGEKIADKIQEFLDIGYMKKNEEIPESVKTLEIFYNIYGVGSKLARKWYTEGLRTLDDVRKRKDLTKAQQLGLKYYQDLKQRIPRSEVEEIGNRIEKVLKVRFPDLDMYIMGSYRRGAETCGDIDLIFTSKTIELIDELFTEICDHLTAAKIMTDTIIVASKIVRGICSIDNGPQRRIDFLLVPIDELGAALIYFTGNDLFNRSIRLLAARKGYHLNRHGLFKATKVGKEVLLGEKIAGSSEEEIFQLLGVPYRPPTERNA
ncbi:hypothetical protein HK103_004694 [Boothiomyces macroporosus]|uniref:DNA polymerase n=1 Tax=Boothiomyces macroporosus TaxID=261099 RepID=A0AAD5UP06_9FUNG|nr:hypothetical protein HK103_004694 [Boothiomyces macroporosus]